MKEAKKKKYRNKARDVIGDYYKTNREYSQENSEMEAKQRSGEEKKKGLAGWSSSEKTLVVVIVVGIIGLIIKYLIL